MPVRLSGDLQCTGLRNRIIHGLEQSEILNYRVIPETVPDVVVSDRYPDGTCRDFGVHDPRLRGGEGAFGG